MRKRKVNNLAKEKFNKYKNEPEATIDLHGYTRAEAENVVLDFLEEAQERNYLKVRIVTGKGWNSPDGVSVLNVFVKSLLDEEGYNYSDSKMSEGGSGALDVKVQ